MNRCSAPRTPISMVVVCCLGLLGCAMGRHQHAVGPPAATIGRLEEAAWTSTTLEAVSTPLHRQTLQHARPATIIGEVVDTSCFLQLGKRGEAHVTCGQKCVRNGQPIGIVADTGELYLVIPEEHHPRRDGQVSLAERFAELMGKRVQVSGMVTTAHETRALFVRTMPVPQP